MSESCGNCRFFLYAANEGECHKRAPYPTTGAATGSVWRGARWPEVAPGDWCGEWQPKPERHEERPDGGGK